MSRTVKRAIQKAGGFSVNRLAEQMLTRGLYIPPFTPDRVLLVEHVGRKSGQTRITPMGWVKAGPRRIKAVAEHGVRSDWVRNALNAGTIYVWIGRERFEARARVLEDEDPRPVWRKMKSKMLVASAIALADKPAVVEIELQKPAPR